VAEKTRDEVQVENEKLRRRIVELERRQNEMNNQLAMYQIILDTCADQIHWLSEDGTHVYVNQAACDNLGYTREELLARKITDIDTLLAPEEWDDYVRHRRSNHAARFETTHRRKDGSTVPIEVSSNYIELDNLGYFCAFARDISERKQQEAALHESTRSYQVIIDSLNDGIFVIQEGKFVFANPAFATIAGYSREELRGYGFQSLVAPEDREWVLDRYQRRQAGEDVPDYYEFRLLARDGETRHWVSMSVFMITYEGSRASMGTVRDITEQKVAENEMKVFKAMADNAPDGFLVGATSPDVQRQVLYMNTALQQLTGYTPADDISIVTLVADDRERLMVANQEVNAHGSWRGDLRYTRKDGTIFDAETAVFVIRDAAGQPWARVALIRDMTERLQMEDARNAMQQQIIDAQQDAMRELSSPLIPISDDVVIMPLIGTLDSQRAQLVLKTLLEGVAHHRARLAILDITGVNVIDTRVAQALISAAQAVKLLGAQVMLTGIQPRIAQTLVHLGVDLQGIITHGSLQTGIAAALQ
jgi:PAS domain S-box-containing protein